MAWDDDLPCMAEMQALGRSPVCTPNLGVIEPGLHPIQYIEYPYSQHQLRKRFRYDITKLMYQETDGAFQCP